MKYDAIAVDGPAGAGKSTIVKKVSKILNYKYVDTGAMYRTVALKVLKSDKNTKIQKDILHCIKDIDIDVKFENDGQVIYLDGENVNDKIRTEEVSKGSSDVAIIPEVRMKLMEIQRNIAKKENVIMDGRDIGTHVLPDARFKIFLTASVETRAKRRQNELKKKGIELSLEQVKNKIKERDYQDSNREIAPLSIAKDATVIDTTNLTIDEVTQKIIDIVSQK